LWVVRQERSDEVLKIELEVIVLRIATSKKNIRGQKYYVKVLLTTPVGLETVASFPYLLLVIACPSSAFSSDVGTRNIPLEGDDRFSTFT